MFLRLLLKLIRPTDKQLKCRNCGYLTSKKIILYRFLLRRLLETYSHFAISDVVALDEGDIKIVHEYRDLEFEGELARNRIDFKSEKLPLRLPVMKRKSSSVRHFGYFRFDDRLTLYVDGKRLHITHDKYYSIDGTLSGRLLGSSGNGCVFQTAMMLSVPGRARVQRNKSGSHPQHCAKKDENADEARNKPAKSPKRQNGSVFGKDRAVVASVSQNGTDSSISVKNEHEKSVLIKKRGFEIDTSF